MAVSKLLRFPSAVKRDPVIKVWMNARAGELGTIAQQWFDVMRGCGDDVRELDVLEIRMNVASDQAA